GTATPAGAMVVIASRNRSISGAGRRARPIRRAKASASAIDTEIPDSVCIFAPSRLIGFSQRRPPLAPAARALIGVGDAQHGRLVEIAADDLRVGRQALAVEACPHGERRVAGHAA